MKLLAQHFTRLVSLAVVMLAASAMPAAAELEKMEVAGAGGQTIFTGSHFIDGRIVNTTVQVFMSIPDGTPVEGVPTSRPYTGVSVIQSDAVTGATLFEGIAYTNVVNISMAADLSAAHLGATLTVSSLSGVGSRVVDLNINWSATAPVDSLRYSDKNAEGGNVKKESFDATLSLAKSTGNIQITHPGVSGHTYTLNPPGNPTALWHTLSTGTRLIKPERGAPGSNVFTATLADTSTCTSGSWSGYWTFDFVNWRWYWTWVWTWNDCGWVVS